MMRAKKTLAVLLAAMLAVSSAAGTALAYGEDGGAGTYPTLTFAKDAFTNWRTNEWESEKDDSGKIVMTPGETERDLNFAWYSQAKGTPAVRIATTKDGLAAAAPVSGTAADYNRTNGTNTYAASNKVSLTGMIAPETTYYYQYTDDVKAQNPVWSDAKTYTSHKTDTFQALYVGDPQIGASKISGSDDTTFDDIAVDTYSWNKTLNQAMMTAPNASFLLSAGDQVDYAGVDASDGKNRREREYAGYLFPEVLRSLPVATTIGNHESLGTDYQRHFNNPNTEDNLGATASGSDYYFSYGGVLFISLNSNNRNTAEHEALMQKAVESHSDAKWKVVMFHHDIYGSGAPHSDIDGANLRILFAPLMDAFDIDVCLTGHDHSYARTFQILNGKVIDYGENAAALGDGSPDGIADPEGTLYLAAGSASGSKFYALNAAKQYYVAERSNHEVPTFSTLDFSGNQLTVKTYDYDGNTYADDFTITKDVDQDAIQDAITSAQSIDASKYTAGSYQKLTTAINEAKTLLDSTAADAGAQKLVDGYDAGLQDGSAGAGDPLNYYGYATGDNKNPDTQALKQGFSTLLDRTLYDNDGQAASKISGAALAAAYQKLTTSMDQLLTKDALKALTDDIAAAQAKHDAAKEGAQKGQYQIGAKAALKAAIDEANQAAGTAEATPAQIEAAQAALAKAVEAFDGKLITVDPSSSDSGSSGSNSNSSNGGNNSNGQSSSNHSGQGTNNSDKPKTGDNIAPILAAAGGLSLAAAGGILALRRRKVK